MYNFDEKLGEALGKVNSKKKVDYKDFSDKVQHVMGHVDRGDGQMNIKQGKSGSYPNLGTITEVKSDEYDLLGGSFTKTKGGKKGKTSAQELIDNILG